VTFTATDSGGATTKKTVTITIGQPPVQGVLTVGEGFAKPGEFIDIPISATEDIPNPSGMSFTLNLNNLTPAGSTALELRDVFAGEGLSNGRVIKSVSQGIATVRITGGTSVQSGNPLAILHLRVPTGIAAGTTAALDLTNVTVTIPGADGKLLAVVPKQVNGGTLTVVMPGNANPGPNGDTTVTAADATKFLRLAVGTAELTPELLAAGDVAPKNPDGTVGDGRITVADIIRILRRAVGLEPDPWP
jgi:hypothetical protein